MPPIDQDVTQPPSAPGSDQHDLSRAEGEGMVASQGQDAAAGKTDAPVLDPQAVAAVAPAAGKLSQAERLAAGETVQVGGVQVKQYEGLQPVEGATTTVKVDPSQTKVISVSGELDQALLEKHTSLGQKVLELAHKCELAVSDDLHAVAEHVGAYLDRLHVAYDAVTTELHQVREAVAASHEPVADGVYDNTVSGFREWYVGDKLQISIAKDTLDFLGNNVPMNLRGKWGVKPDMPKPETEAQAATGTEG